MDADNRQTSIGHYRLVRLLGKGPFSIVYLVQNIFVQEIQYVVKRPAETSSEHIQLLQRRASILSRLNHSSIIKTHILENSEPAIGLTFAQQGSLYELVSAGYRCDLRFIIQCTLQLANALDYAHDQGFVHGNLKAQNVLFDRSGSALLSDFDVPMSTFVQSPLVLQILPYRAPEQEKQLVSPATDQYQLAYLVDDWLQSQETSLQASLEVIDVFRQTLRKAKNADAAQRYPNMRLFAQELEKVAATLPQTTKLTASLPLRRATPLVLSGVTLFLLLILVGGLLAGLSLKKQITSELTPTAQSTVSPQTLYRNITNARPTIDNPSAGNGVGQWILQQNRFGGACSLSGGIVYLVNPSTLSPEVDCTLGNLTAHNFAFQAEMHFLHIDRSPESIWAGLFFRGSYIYFLDIFSNECSFNVRSNPPIHDYTDCSFYHDKNAKNSLCVIALENTFYLYINQLYVATVADKHYQSGSLGVFLLNNDPVPTRLEVSFVNVKVWIL